MFDKNEELITVVDPEYLLESEQTQELNGLITTIVSAPYSKELESAFYIGSRDIDDNNIFWLYKVDKRTKENNNIILNGTYSLFDDLKAYDVIRDKRPSNTSALVGINAVLEGSRWQVGNITTTHTGSANWYYVSRLEAFWEYLENWNVEFKPRMTFSKGKITGRYIDIVDKLSNDYGKWYEYGDKLLQVTAEQASDSLYTAFVGRGKGEESGNGYGRRIGFEKVVWTTASGKPVNKPLNQDYIEIHSATELYGYSDGKPRMTVVIFEDEEDSVKVLERTYDYALNECRPKLQLKADVLEDGVSELGETCTIIRDDRGIRYKTRVFKLTRNFLNKKQRTAEFGDEIVQSTAQRNSNTAKEIKKQEKQVINWLDDLQKELLDSYFNEDGYNYDLKADNEYDLPGGFYSFNAPIDQNPTKVIYMGAGTLAIANSKTPDGQWLFRTWGTGDGFTADLINAGTLNANLVNVTNIKASSIIAGTLSSITSDTGTLYVNGDLPNFLYTNAIDTNPNTLGIHVYLRPTVNGEVRTTATKTTDVFVPIRTLGVRSPPGANGYFGVDGELRITSTGYKQEDSTYYYKNVRANGYYGGFLETTATSLWIGVDSTLHVTSKETVGNVGLDSATYRAIWAGDIRTSAIISSTGNGYFGVDGELRVVNTGLSDIYRPIRASAFNVSSGIEYKKNIEEYQDSALDVINGTQVKLYNLNEEIDDFDYKHVGLIAQESPLEIINFTGGNSIDLYAMSSLLWKGEQELDNRLKKIENDLQRMENDNG